LKKIVLGQKNLDQQTFEQHLHTHNTHKHLLETKWCATILKLQKYLQSKTKQS
jgi:hypothetical protein